MKYIYIKIIIIIIIFFYNYVKICRPTRFRGRGLQYFGLGLRFDIPNKPNFNKNN